MTARENILNRVRTALARKVSPQNTAAKVTMDAHIAAHPTGFQPQRDWLPEERFRARAEALTSTVEKLSSLQSVPGAVARYLVAHNLPTGGIVWPSLRKLDWIGAGLGMEDRPARGDDLVGVTGCYCAVAETGTLMLLSGPDTPAAASLLPETHIAIVDTARIVPFMEDAWALLRAERGHLPRAVNFVSGPSRTADIEQTVTLGAHGPYRVHIILVGA